MAATKTTTTAAEEIVREFSPTETAPATITENGTTYYLRTNYLSIGTHRTPGPVRVATYHVRPLRSLMF